MHAKRAATMVAILAVTMIGVSGLAASASSSQGRPAGAGQAKAAGAELLRFMSTKAVSRQISVIASGAFTAGGTDRPGRVTDVLRFPGGTLRYRHVMRTFSASFDPQT